MKTLSRISLLFAFGAALTPAIFAQLNTITATTLSGAVLGRDTVINVTSATGIVAPTSGNNGTQLYVLDPGSLKGEIMTVTGVSSTAVTVTRNQSARTPHVSGAAVLIGKANLFYKYDPVGGCTTASTYVTPWINTNTGMQWFCSTITLSWVPGFQNTAAPAQVTTAVASAAGATAIGGPLLHITGTNAITSFTMGAGWAGGGFCAIPDAAFTTTATNNIGKASTGVINKVLCWTWDATNSVFLPTY